MRLVRRPVRRVKQSATAHVPTHAIAAAIYAATAVRDGADAADADAATYQERVWQYQHLLALGER